MKNLLFIFAFTAIFANLYSQSDLVWSKVDTAGYKLKEPGTHILNINADTITVVGKVFLGSFEKLNVIKYDLSGNIISNNTYGYCPSYYSDFKDYVIDNNDNIYLLYHKSTMDSTNLLMQKYAANGNLLWNKEISSNADTFYIPRNISVINDTCIFLTAYKFYPDPTDSLNYIEDAVLFAYNTSGAKLWERNLSQLGMHTFKHDLFVHNNSAYFFMRDLFVIVNANNAFTTGNNSHLLEFMGDMQITPDSNLLLTARNTYTLHKVKPNGDNIWTKEYMPNIMFDELNNVIQNTTQDSNGNIYVTGFFKHDNNGTVSSTNYYLLTIKYDNNGNLIWENKFAYPNTSIKTISSMVYKNGNLYLGGQSGIVGDEFSDNFELLKIDALSGIIIGSYIYDYGLNDAISEIKVYDDNKIVLTGLNRVPTCSDPSPRYMWTTQLLSKVTSIEVIKNSNNAISIYPNPIINGNTLTINSKGFISYSIISLNGKLIQKADLNKDEINKIKIGDLATGVYMLQLQTDTETVSSKMVVY